MYAEADLTFYPSMYINSGVSILERVPDIVLCHYVISAYIGTSVLIGQFDDRFRELHELHKSILNG